MTVHRLPAPRTRMLSVHRINEMISKGEIQLDAPYQREIVWEASKMSELIDSVINNFYIPPLLFAVRQIRGRPGRPARIVIDGKQRLTSARRFLKNLIPYVDNSSGKPVAKYYFEHMDQDADDETESALRHAQKEPKHFISAEEFDIFNKFEFVCVEYLEITEDDEFEIFSRVQLGVAITSAEKLKATNSKIAEDCRRLTDENHEISAVLQRKGHAALFQLIAHLMLTIKNGTDGFPTTKALQDYVHSNETPSVVLIDKLEFVLSVIKSIAIDKELKNVIVKGGPVNTKNAVKAIEFIVFGTYISLVERTRTIRHYSRDFESLRQYLVDTREGKAYLGREAFMEAMVWVNDRLEKENLVSAQKGIHTIPDNDDYDELKEEEAAPIPAYNSRQTRTPQATPTATTITSTAQVQKSPSKRRRDDRNGSAGVAVAKRGGKLPAGLGRRRS